MPQNWREMRHLAAKQAELQEWRSSQCHKKGVFTYMDTQGTKIINSGKYFPHKRRKHWWVIDPKCISTWDTKQDKCSCSSNSTFERYCFLLGCMVHRNIQHIFDSLSSTKVCIMTFWSKKNMRKMQRFHKPCMRIELQGKSLKIFLMMEIISSRARWMGWDGPDWAH